MEARLKPFRAWLLSEIKKRDMSAREFARWVGLTNTTINKYLDERDERIPSIESLVAIAQKTGTPVDTLLTMIYPDIDERFLRADDRTMELVQKITQLPPEKREIVEAFIIGTLLQQSNKGE
ncbi:MAG TPA: helix-turn-helix transcriptional regulator [Aggregatilineales bacterium]|nr:helix-turn-helix transcriptional regulator [Aggregatilineales bacterium]